MIFIHKMNRRYKTTGYSIKNRLLIVIHTDRENVIRIITARKANKSEQDKIP